jgi:hypothetical protein
MSPPHHYIKAYSKPKSESSEDYTIPKTIYLARHFLIRLGSPCPEPLRFYPTIPKHNPQTTSITRFLHETALPLPNW